MLTTARILALTAVATPAFAYLADRHLLKRRIGPLLFILACIIAYLLVIASLICTEVWIENAMYTFDTDGSGDISGPELTPAATDAINARQNDTGRNFAPATSLVLIPFWSGIVYTLLWALHLPFSRTSDGG